MKTRRVTVRPASNGSHLCGMEVSFQPKTLATMVPHARVWIYKSAAAFTIAQRDAILSRGVEFTRTWAAHGAQLDACVEVLHDHFVVIAVDEAQAMASGCSIDTSVQFVRALETDLQLQLTDRMVVLYERDGAIKSTRVPLLEALIASGELTADTIVFDDLVSTKADLDARFRVKLRESWMARFL